MSDPKVQFIGFQIESDAPSSIPASGQAFLWVKESAPDGYIVLTTENGDTVLGSGGGGGGGETLAETLALGNSTSGNDIDFSTGDGITSDGLTIVDAGNSSWTASGYISIATESKNELGDVSNTSNLTFYTGNTYPDGTGNTGNIILHTGSTADAQSGYISLYTGSGEVTGESGNISIFTGNTYLFPGNGGDSGNLSLYTGGANSTHVSGDITISSGNAANTGQINLFTGSSNTGIGASGGINIHTGSESNSSDSGDVNIYSGSCGSSGFSGNVKISSGFVSSGIGSGDAGDIILSIGRAFSNGNDGSLIIQDSSNRKIAAFSQETYNSIADGYVLAWNAAGEYLEYIQNSSSSSQTLAQTLALGNSTGGNDINFSTGDGITSNGLTIIDAGDSSWTGTGNISITTESQDGAEDVLNTSSLTFSTGKTYPSGTGETGDIILFTGSTADAQSGYVSIATGISNGNSGSVSLESGIAGQNSGDVEIKSGNADITSGSINIYSGDGVLTPGDVNITTGEGEGDTGDVNIITGISYGSGNVGNVNVILGLANSGNDGSFVIENSDTDIIAAFTSETLSSQNDGYVLAWNASGEYLEYIQNGSGSSQTLAQTLAIGNSTNGTDLVISDGDSIVSGGDGYVNISDGLHVTGDGYFEQDVTIIGKLTVNDLIDPTGMVFDVQSSVPGGTPIAGKSTLWVRNSDGSLIVTDENGIDTEVGEASDPTYVPTNFTPAGSDIDGYLEGIDDAFVNFNQFTEPTVLQDGYIPICNNGDLSYLRGDVNGDVLYWNESSISWEPQTPIVPQLSDVLISGNSAGNTSITNLNDPVDNQDAVTKGWVLSRLSTLSIPGLNLVHEVGDLSTLGQTEFTLSQTPSDGYADGYSVLMFINQLKVEIGDYSVDGNVVEYVGDVELDPGTDTVEFYYPRVPPGGFLFKPLLSGIATNDSSGWKVVGMTEIDSTEFSGDAVFETILFSSDGYADGYARLFNATTASVVTDSELTTTNNLPEHLTSSIILDGGSNIYELQIKVEQDGIDEFVSCGMGRIKISERDSNPSYISILSGVETNDGYAWQDFGYVEINSDQYSFTTAYFEALLSSTDGYEDDDQFVAEARLFNITTAQQVGSIISSESNLAELVNTEVTLASGSNVYSVQLRLSEDGGGSEFAKCAMARIKLE